MSQVALGNIKTQLKSILDLANTTTGSPIDLSANMAQRVARVMKVNLAKIPIQPSFFPCLTMWYDSKSVELVTIARDLATGKRQAEFGMILAGMTWEQITSNVDVDPSDEQIEFLMENAEEIIRTKHTLNGTVSWCYPSSVQYHTFPHDEQVHLRIGIMALKIKTYY